MSYDLTLFHIPDGVDPSAAFRRTMEEEEERLSAGTDAVKQRPVSESSRAEMRRTADALKSWRPALEEFQPESPRPWIELNDDELELQFSVQEGRVDVSIPYFRDRAQEIMECVTSCFDVLQRAANYQAYDPQLERVVTARDLDEMIAKYRSVDRVLPQVVARSRASGVTPKKPWWKIW